MKILDEQQVRSYHHEGFLFPVPVLNAVEVAQCVRDLERAEAHIGQPLTRAELKWRGAAYAYLPWVDALVRHPRVLDVVEDVIGRGRGDGTARGGTVAAPHPVSAPFGTQPLHAPAYRPGHQLYSRPCAHHGRTSPDRASGAGQRPLEPF
jgi:hypothetical protein